jgi:hypothetical protein
MYTCFFLASPRKFGGRFIMTVLCSQMHSSPHTTHVDTPKACRLGHMTCQCNCTRKELPLMYVLSSGPFAREFCPLSIRNPSPCQLKHLPIHHTWAKLHMWTKHVQCISKKLQTTHEALSTQDQHTSSYTTVHNMPTTRVSPSVSLPEYPQSMHQDDRP